MYTASFKEFGSLVCLWHDVKLRKTQLEVRSLNVTWRRDLWCHRVIVFFLNVSNCWLNSYSKFGGATRRRFSAICKKPEGGGADNRPPPGRARVKASLLTIFYHCHIFIIVIYRDVHKKLTHLFYNFYGTKRCKDEFADTKR